MNFIKAVKVILPKKLPILAVGGVDENNLQDWRLAGADVYGLGSSLYKPGMGLEEIAERCRAVIKFTSREIFNSHGSIIADRSI